MDRLNFRKDFRDCYSGQAENWPVADWRLPSNDPRNNRPFYRYCSHIELIGLKEYYWMNTIRYTRNSIYAHFSAQFFFNFS